MLTSSKLFQIILAAMFISMAVSVYAQPAPVYDADNMQENVGDQAQYLPPPPPPDQETGGTFIPVQPTVSAAPAQPHLSMDQRMQRMEQQVNNMQTSESTTRVDSLQEQLQTLRGQVEQLTHQLEQLKNQQKSMYTDLDGRLAGSAGAAKKLALNNTQDALQADQPVADQVKPPEELPVATPTLQKQDKPILIKTSRKQTISSEKDSIQPNVAEEQQIYQTAYNFIKAKKYNDAVNALQGMLKKYPSGQFASNAHYWLGELFGLMGKNDQALNEFRIVVDIYPESPRVSDAQLKVGLLLASQLKWSEAKSALRRVINHYPGSASARLAAEQLKQIKIAGH